MKIRPGPVRQELTSDESRQVASLYVGYRLMFPEDRDTLEQWELGFMRDAHPDREIAAWKEIIAEYHRTVKSLGHAAARERAVQMSLAQQPIIIARGGRK